MEGEDFIESRQWRAGRSWRRTVYPRNHAGWRLTYSHVMSVRGIGVGTQMQKAALGLNMFTADANMYMCTIHNSCT
jgi:hypothetical protein